MVSACHTLSDFGIGQGRRSGVHKFGVLTRPLTDGCAAVGTGVGLDPPEAVVFSFQATAGLPFLPEGAADANEQVKSLAEELVANRPHMPRWLEAFRSIPSAGGRARLLDAVSVTFFLMIQFIDDSFILQSACEGLATVNRALSEFCRTWRHKFGQGSKRPRVLAVASAKPMAEQCGKVGEEHPGVVEEFPAMGS